MAVVFLVLLSSYVGLSYQTILSAAGDGSARRKRGGQPRMILAYKLALVGGLSLFLVFAFRGYYPDAITSFKNIAIPTMAGIATLAFLFSWRRDGFRSEGPSARAHIAFGMGVLLWFLATASWSAYPLLLNASTPYPGLPDVFYVAGKFPLMLGAYLSAKRLRSGLPMKSIALVTALVLALGALVFVLLVLPAVPTRKNPVAMALEYVYPGLDLLLVTSILVSSWILIRGRAAREWLILGSAIVLEVVWYYVIVNLMVSLGNYVGGWSNLIETWMYLLFALAFTLHKVES